MLIAYVLVFLALVLMGVFKLAAKKNVIKGVQWHDKHEFFWGSVRYLRQVIVVEKSTTLQQVVFEELKKTEFKPIAFSFVNKVYFGFAEPEDVKWMLKDDFLAFEKGSDFIAIFEGLLGGGIFNANGAPWKEQRTVAAHLFNRRQLRDRMSNVFGIHAQQLVNVLREKVEAAGGNAAVEIQDHFMHFTFDAINSVAFNRHVDSQSGNAVDCAFQNAFDTCQRVAMNRFLQPWWPVSRALQCTQEERDMTKGQKTINDYVYKVVDDYVDESGKVRSGVVTDDQTLTGLFLQHAQDEGKDYGKEFIRDMILNFVIAGRDTTASALTSTIEFLTEPANQHWQDRLAAEADACFSGNSNEPLTFDDITDRSPVSEAVFMEALRLHPSVPVNNKCCVRETTFPSGITIPAGTNVIWSPVATNQIPRIWGKDAASFNPQRWITPENTITTKYDDYVYPTFNAGPRLCLGKNMAVLEAKIALLTLFAHLRFSRKNPEVVPKPVASVTWQYAPGFTISVHPRK